MAEVFLKSWRGSEWRELWCRSLRGRGGEGWGGIRTILHCFLHELACKLTSWPPLGYSRGSREEGKRWSCCRVFCSGRTGERGRWVGQEAEKRMGIWEGQ